jgi:hypothetical protein
MSAVVQMTKKTSRKRLRMIFSKGRLAISGVVTRPAVVTSRRSSRFDPVFQVMRAYTSAPRQTITDIQMPTHAAVRRAWTS